LKDKIGKKKKKKSSTQVSKSLVTVR